MGEGLKDQPLTRRAVEKHIIKVIITSVVLAIIGYATTSFTFYYTTNNKMNNLIESDVKQNEDIKNFTITLDNINDKLGKENTNTAVDDERIENLEEDMKEVKQEIGIMREDVKDILKIVGDIKRNQ